MYRDKGGALPGFRWKWQQKARYFEACADTPCSHFLRQLLYLLFWAVDSLATRVLNAETHVLSSALACSLLGQHHTRIKLGRNLAVRKPPRLAARQ